MDFSLSAEEHEFKLRFERFCQERIAPRATQADLTGQLPRENWCELVDAGYFGLFHPVALGGSGASGIVQAIAMECLAQACASTLWTVTISTALCGKILHNLCGPRHHERWLRPIIAGERVGCFAATEHGSGSDPGSYRTSVTTAAGGYRLNGEKSRISNAGVADVAVVLARLEGSQPAGSAGLCYVVVDLHTHGVRRAEQEKLGLRAMSWGKLSFEDVEIEPEDVIANADMDATLQSVEWGQLLQSLCAIGIAEAALSTATAFAAERQAFGRPIRALPGRAFPTRPDPRGDRRRTAAGIRSGLAEGPGTSGARSRGDGQDLCDRDVRANGGRRHAHAGRLGLQ